MMPVKIRGFQILHHNLVVQSRDLGFGKAYLLTLNLPIHRHTFHIPFLRLR